jgi:hypothetical protein
MLTSVFVSVRYSIAIHDILITITYRGEKITASNASLCMLAYTWVCRQLVDVNGIYTVLNGPTGQTENSTGSGFS